MGLLPQILVVPPQIKLHLPVTLSTGTFATSLQCGDCPQAERVPASLQPPRSPTPIASPPLGLGGARNQNPKSLPLGLSHHVPRGCLWGRRQPMAKQTSKQGMTCQCPLLAVAPNFTCSSLLRLPFLGFGVGTATGPSPLRQGLNGSGRYFYDCFPQAFLLSTQKPTKPVWSLSQLRHRVSGWSSLL